jgi:Ca2+-binding RTX toxin-like protein
LLTLRAGNNSDWIENRTGVTALIIGGAGNDVLIGGVGADVIYGGGSAKRIFSNYRLADFAYNRNSPPAGANKVINDAAYSALTNGDNDFIFADVHLNSLTNLTDYTVQKLSSPNMHLIAAQGGPSAQYVLIVMGGIADTTYTKNTGGTNGYTGGPLSVIGWLSRRTNPTSDLLEKAIRGLDPFTNRGAIQLLQPLCPSVVVS